MSISQTFTAFPTPLPDRAADTPSEFSDNVDAFLAHINTFVTDGNVWVTQANALATELNAAVLLAQAYRDEAQASQNATEYDAGETYDYPDTVIGSDGHAYRCLSTGIIGDDPVGSVTGDWVRITTGALTVLESRIEDAENFMLALAIM